MAKRARWNEGKAREVLSRWEGSGLAVGEFARREGVAVSRLRRWQGKLGVAPGGGFVAVELGPGRPGAFVVELGGLSVRVFPGFDAGELRRLLLALRAC